MYTLAYAQTSRALLKNFGPLQTVVTSGRFLVRAARFKTSVTRLPVSEWSTSNAGHFPLPETFENFAANRAPLQNEGKKDEFTRFERNRSSEK